jgi:hypothetical protein
MTVTAAMKWDPTGGPLASEQVARAARALPVRSTREAAAAPWGQQLLLLGQAEAAPSLCTQPMAPQAQGSTQQQQQQQHTSSYSSSSDWQPWLLQGTTACLQQLVAWGLGACHRRGPACC